MHLSLRTRLSLLLALALAMAIIPLLVVSHRYVGDNSLRLERNAFVSILNVAEENLNSHFMNLVANKVGDIIKRKNSLMRAARQMDSLLDLQKEGDGAGNNAGYLETFVQQISQEGIWVGRFDLSERAFDSDGLSLLRSQTDLKGRSLNELLARLGPSGDFAVFSLPRLPVALSPNGESGNCLFFFLPASQSRAERQGLPPRRQVIVSAVSLLPLEANARAAEARLIEAVSQRFSTISIHADGFITLLDSGGSALAMHGTLPRLPGRLLGDLLDEARALGRVERQIDLTPPEQSEREYFTRIVYVRPFDWFLVIAAPMDDILAPSRMLLQRLALLGAMVALAALAFSLELLSRVVRPLRLLMQKTRELPGVDFSSPEAVSAIADGLPLERRDEVGELAAAYAAMGEHLCRNIRERMETDRLRERMRGELKAAREIQQGILPPASLAPNIFGLSSSALLDPAKEVGGDLYDFFSTGDGRHAFVLGDVSGKGVPAALFMAMTVTLVRFTLSDGRDPAAAMTRINTLLQSHNPGHMFVTLFLALYDARSGELEYANGGHCPPLVLANTASPALRSLAGQSGPLVGVMPGLEYTLHKDRLVDGELCLLFTDGITEAENEKGDFYGLERLEAYLAERRQDAPKDLLGGIYNDILRFRGQAPPSDDITMLAFARRSA
ncbi:SpoIIE family protein phosphatase [Desulfovibrio sp. OttesenSCG-928-G11]|nr:SpoIIE family protein phosphatase [Desulfovibrio sp. OttesenSCG-928-G11]